MHINNVHSFSKHNIIYVRPSQYSPPASCYKAPSSHIIIVIISHDITYIKLFDKILIANNNTATTWQEADFRSRYSNRAVTCFNNDLWQLASHQHQILDRKLQAHLEWRNSCTCRGVPVSSTWWGAMWCWLSVCVNLQWRCFILWPSSMIMYFHLICIKEYWDDSYLYIGTLKEQALQADLS